MDNFTIKKPTCNNTYGQLIVYFIYQDEINKYDILTAKVMQYKQKDCNIKKSNIVAFDKAFQILIENEIIKEEKDKFTLVNKHKYKLYSPKKRTNKKEKPDHLISFQAFGQNKMGEKQLIERQYQGLDEYLIKHKMPKGISNNTSLKAYIDLRNQQILDNIKKNIAKIDSDKLKSNNLQGILLILYWALNSKQDHILELLDGFAYDQYKSWLSLNKHEDADLQKIELKMQRNFLESNIEAARKTIDSLIASSIDKSRARKIITDYNKIFDIKSKSPIKKPQRRIQPIFITN